MAYDENLAKRVRSLLARRKGIQEKKMFGGVGFLLRGNMLVGVWKEYLIVRLGPEQAEEALLAPNVKVFDITGKAMKGWVMVEPEGIEDEDKLKVWLQLATNLVNTLPAK